MCKYCKICNFVGFITSSLLSVLMKNSIPKFFTFFISIKYILKLAIAICHERNVNLVLGRVESEEKQTGND